MANDRINPEDELRILLPADKIPDKSTVYKRTGEASHTLCRNLTLYQYGKATDASKPVVIAGYFLVGGRGSITQIEPDHMLHWYITAEALVDELRCSWEQESSQ